MLAVSFRPFIYPMSLESSVILVYAVLNLQTGFHAQINMSWQVFSIKNILYLTIKLEEWCKSSSLFINVGKTKELIFKPSRSTPITKLCDQTMETVSCCKYLGTYIDDKLSLWTLWIL